MGSIIIHNNIEIIKKDIKNISLKVKPTGVVVLSVPLLTTHEHIIYVLKKREEWISEKLEFFQSNYKPQVKEYVSGENFKYLGKNYRLKVIESDNEGVKLQRGYLQLFIKNKDNIERKKRLIEKWYHLKAENYFQKIIVIAA